MEEEKKRIEGLLARLCDLEEHLLDREWPTKDLTFRGSNLYYCVGKTEEAAKALLASLEDYEEEEP